MSPDLMLEAARKGDMRSVARVLTAIENRTDDGRRFFSALFADSGSAATTGVTGAPGAGKSTLVSALISRLLRVDGRVAVLAVDPSSPFTGGALLGDRIRMAEHADNTHVFIRSLANRGSLGGISETTPSVVSALDGLGFGEVVVETVGVGQSEVEIATTADTTVVVVAAGWGDTVQASKAGFLEVADVLVVNKADRSDADRTAHDLEAMVALGGANLWTPPVIRTVATDGRGVDDVAAAITEHRRHLQSSGEAGIRDRTRAARHLAAAIRLEMETADPGRNRDDVVARIVARDIDPWSAATRFVAES